MGLSLVQGPMGPPRRRKSCPRKWSLGAQKNAFLYGPEGPHFWVVGPVINFLKIVRPKKNFLEKKKHGFRVGESFRFFFSRKFLAH